MSFKKIISKNKNNKNTPNQVTSVTQKGKAMFSNLCQKFKLGEREMKYHEKFINSRR